MKSTTGFSFESSQNQYNQSNLKPIHTHLMKIWAYEHMKIKQCLFFHPCAVTRTEQMIYTNHWEESNCVYKF